MRVPDISIKARVQRIQNTGADIGLDGQYGQWRVTTRNGDRNLSPRAPNREIYEWLAAYEEGFEAGKAHAVGELRHGREVVGGG